MHFHIVYPRHVDNNISIFIIIIIGFRVSIFFFYIFYNIMIQNSMHMMH